MSKNKVASENYAIKSAIFVSILEKDENTGKIDYSTIVYKTKSKEAAYKFATENFIRSVTTSVKTGEELIKLGVDEKKLKMFKNPDLY